MILILPIYKPTFRQLCSVRNASLNPENVFHQGCTIKPSSSPSGTPSDIKLSYRPIRSRYCVISQTLNNASAGGRTGVTYKCAASGAELCLLQLMTEYGHTWCNSGAAENVNIAVLCQTFYGGGFQKYTS